jgi:methionyl-tRNA formyltransferase
MKVLLLANNWVGWKVAEYLSSQDSAEVVGVVVHPDQKQKYRDEICDAFAISSENIFDGSCLADPDVLASIQKLEPDIGVSVLFDYILSSEFLGMFPKGCINIHPAYLPYNRGSYPNIFSIVDGTPAGATVHYMEETIDTGDIIGQKEVEVRLSDTGESLYRKLEQACIDVFIDVWPSLVNGPIERTPQRSKEGTVHRYKDVDEIDEIDLEREYRAHDLIAVIRARTFVPYKGAFIKDKDGKKIYLRLSLTHEDDHE